MEGGNAHADIAIHSATKEKDQTPPTAIKCASSWILTSCQPPRATSGRQECQRHSRSNATRHMWHCTNLPQTCIRIRVTVVTAVNYFSLLTASSTDSRHLPAQTTLSSTRAETSIVDTLFSLRHCRENARDRTSHLQAACISLTKTFHLVDRDAHDALQNRLSA